MNLLGLSITIAIGFILANCADQYQVFARAVGAQKGAVATGFQRAMEGMLINRLGTTLYFLGVAFFIETSGKISRYVAIITISLLVIVAWNSWLLIALRQFRDLQTRQVRRGHWFNRITVAAFIATLFSMGGLTIPYGVAMCVPSYRLTIANSGFMLNAVFTLLMTLVVDRSVAFLIDHNNQEVLIATYQIVAAKTLAIGCACIVACFMSIYLR